MPDAPRPQDEALRALRAALDVSPDNLPLRVHLADSLAAAGRFEEAEAEFRRALEQAPGDESVRLALARCYLAQDKAGHAAVLVELAVERPSPSAEAFVLLARVRFAERDPKGARQAFRRAVELDPSLAGGDVARSLGLVDVTPPGPASDEDESVEFEDAFDADDGPRPQRRDGADPDDDGEGIVGDRDFERPELSFEDVGGMDDVKDEIAMKVIQPLAHPELFAAYGKKAGGGVLLYGPPGCGKTHLARATAGEASAHFMSVGIHDVLEMWTGASERNLHAIFTEARRRRPCVLFFDEVDALGAKRTDMLNASSRQTINQFLSELDGVNDDNEGLLVLAATNAPWHVDSAFRRPGRFDRLVFVPPPDEPARAAILGVLLRDKPVEAFEPTKLARKTERFSGADLKAVVDLAVEEKLREALKKGAPSPLSEKDLLRAAKRVKPSTSEWFATAKNHVLFANEGGAYDDVARYMGLSDR